MSATNRSIRAMRSSDTGSGDSTTGASGQDLASDRAAATMIMGTRLRTVSAKPGKLGPVRLGEGGLEEREGAVLVGVRGARGVMEHGEQPCHLGVPRFRGSLRRGLDLAVQAVLDELARAHTRGPLAVVDVRPREEEAARPDAEGSPVVDHFALAPGDEMELVRRVGVPFYEPVALLEHDAEPAHPDEVPEHRDPDVQLREVVRSLDETVVHAATWA